MFEFNVICHGCVLFPSHSGGFDPKRLSNFLAIFPLLRNTFFFFAFFFFFFFFFFFSPFFPPALTLLVAAERQKKQFASLLSSGAQLCLVTGTLARAKSFLGELYRPGESSSGASSLGTSPGLSD
jgi:hypothetical protein